MISRNITCYGTKEIKITRGRGCVTCGIAVNMKIQRELITGWSERRRALKMQGVQQSVRSFRAFTLCTEGRAIIAGRNDVPLSSLSLATTTRVVCRSFYGILSSRVLASLPSSSPSYARHTSATIFSHFICFSPYRHLHLIAYFFKTYIFPAPLCCILLSRLSPAPPAPSLLSDKFLSYNLFTYQSSTNGIFVVYKFFHTVFYFHKALSSLFEGRNANVIVSSREGSQTRL